MCVSSTFGIPFVPINEHRFPSSSKKEEHYTYYKERDRTLPGGESVAARKKTTTAEDRKDEEQVDEVGVSTIKQNCGSFPWLSPFQ